MADNTQRERDDLLQELIERMMSIMRKVRHDTVPSEPLLSPPQLHILFTIAMKKTGVSVSELAELTGVTPGAVTQFVNGLVERDLVARETDASDRRVVRLQLTPNARGQMAKMRREYLTAAARTFEVLSLEEIRTLSTIIARINVALEKEETSPDSKDKAGPSARRT
jgi:DNA-binding MarR family transcriptional regulator